ncbi:hypothetical protein DHEL01_v204343 [Diaporthe helianthi]|uniref:Uncharacterized protein n=1 Tax=Diaporthe helianthi TaxID=158607 RepID=A0A2P5I449_DIAHE|nr:hypothetical protein DHEL01_v204343 [Diaporthe helianthi]
MVAFRGNLWAPSPGRGGDGEETSWVAGEEQNDETVLSALQYMGTMLKVEDIWLISVFFFAVGGVQALAAGGKCNINPMYAAMERTKPPKYCSAASRSRSQLTDSKRSR